MTQEEILQYNKLCAEFLGYKYYPYPNKDTGWRKNKGHLIFGKSYYLGRTTKHLQFHSDWNWIMEMVEAIEKLYDHPNKEINVDIRPGQIEIFQRPYRLESNDYHEVIYLGDGYINGSKKEAVVEAINQFLIWYNKNKTI